MSESLERVTVAKDDLGATEVAEEEEAAEVGLAAETSRSLLEALDAALAGGGPAYVVDLHTTSGPGGVFTTMSDSIRNRNFALQQPVPLILGLQEQVDGTLLGHLGDRGHVTLSLESGQHDEPRAVDRAVAGIWIAVATAGLLPERAIPELPEARATLAGDSRGLPEVLEIRYRHPVAPEDGFVMRDGYRNFQAIGKGELLGSDYRGEVRSPERGRILMPLYQEQGEDGFFVVREIHPLWLRFSEILRRWNVDRWVHWLPGIAKDPDSEDLLVVNRRVARWYALQILHLLGFRKVRDQDHRLVVIRRPGSR